MVKFFRKGEVLLPEYRIIDAHTHIYPDKIADKAGEAIGSFYNVPIYHTGTAEELLKSGEKIGVDKFLICSAATSPKQVTSINDFIIYECSKHEKFIGFGSVHPDFENIDAELKRIKAAGLGGVKLHPDFQQFLVDDQKALPLWKAICTGSYRRRQTSVFRSAPNGCGFGGTAGNQGDCGAFRRISGLGTRLRSL